MDPYAVKLLILFAILITATLIAGLRVRRKRSRERLLAQREKALIDGFNERQVRLQEIMIANGDRELLLAQREQALIAKLEKRLADFKCPPKPDDDDGKEGVK
jgi:hypothetical protein